MVNSLLYLTIIIIVIDCPSRESESKVRQVLEVNMMEHKCFIANCQQWNGYNLFPQTKSKSCTRLWWKSWFYVLFLSCSTCFWDWCYFILLFMRSLFSSFFSVMQERLKMRTKRARRKSESLSIPLRIFSYFSLQ